MKKNEIINFCNSLGIDTIGFIKCRKFEELKPFFYERKEKGLENEFEEEDVEKRINPFILNPYMKNIMYPYNKLNSLR